MSLMAARVRAVTVTAEQTIQALSLAQDAQDAALGDSNDREIGALRDALEYALELLGLGLPDPREDEDD